ncbi:MAG: DUF1499 domain-containing protein [Deltaproteobacteria bacterium]|nr:DUF1499 domain-containing protein [Deltaproteobacteria bacterium]MBW2681634.1 DUF1499 domain-containing protein [Deltaproteobacteria bacterium]
MYRSIQLGLKMALIVFMVNGCSGKRPDEMGIDPSGLRGCPKSPNCVSSEAKDETHAIEWFRLKGDPNVSWPLIQDEIASMPRWTIVTATDNYIHVECKSRVFRFIDDLELYFNSSNGIISIRSASRVGYWDFGANRRRVELLRSELRTKQLIE